MNYSLTVVTKVIVSFALVFLLVNNYAHAEISDSEKKPLIEKLKSAKVDPTVAKGEKRYIVLFKDKVGNQDLDDLVKKGAKIKHNLKSIQGVSISADDLKVQQIKSNKKIKNVVEDTVMSISLSTSVPLIGANSVHAVGVTGTGAKVCIVDTGVDDTHPALNHLIAEYDFVHNDNDATDDNGHGTHVAGIIASKDSTYKGVAPNASLMAAKVLDNTGSGWMSDVILGIDWCVSNGADAINLSLGGTAVVGTCDTNASAIAVNNAVDQGVVVAAASGNNGFINAISTPACASKAIAVGATDNSDGRTSFSNEGIELDVVAPGVGITSLRAPINGGGFTSLSGTSMATPHVAGLAALLLSTNPLLTAPQIISAIKNTSLDLGTPGFDTIYGFGRIRAYNAYQSVMPALSISDVSVTEGNSGFISAVFTVTLSNPSASVITVNYATSDVTAIAGSDYTNTSGTLTFAPGSTVQTVSVPVIGDMTVEPNETFNVQLSGATNASISDGTGMGTIINDDSPPTISIGDASVTEGNSGFVSANFTVTLSSPAPVGGVSFLYRTINGTAASGTDFVPHTSTPASIPVGSTSTIIPVAVFGDTAVEPNENFSAVIFGASGATISSDTAIGTILNDDVLPPIPTTLYCGKTVDQFDSVINGTESNDVLVGTSGADLIDGLGGDDRIWGKGGDDCIFGGEDNDYLVGGAGNDEIDGENGNDKIWGQLGMDVLYGAFGNDRIAGGADNDSIFGEEDNDYLWGQAGDDTLDGGTQTDICVGGIGTNTITTCE